MVVADACSAVANHDFILGCEQAEDDKFSFASVVVNSSNQMIVVVVLMMIMRKKKSVGTTFGREVKTNADNQKVILTNV